jgi:hypothetical protein
LQAWLCPGPFNIFADHNLTPVLTLSGLAPGTYQVVMTGIVTQTGTVNTNGGGVFCESPADDVDAQWELASSPATTTEATKSGAGVIVVAGTAGSTSSETISCSAGPNAGTTAMAISSLTLTATKIANIQTS